MESILCPLLTVLNTGQITNDGPLVREFEELLSEYLGQTTLCFSSGMSALTAMLMAAQLDGREVIVPSFTFPATIHAINAAGAIPVYADIDRDTLTMSVIDAEKKITQHTGAILAVDVYGICSRYDELSALCARHGLQFMVDSAPAFGSVYNFPPSRPWSRIYSFHATKAFAVGEGGCLCSTDEQLLFNAKRIRNFGLVGDQVVLPGLNGKMTEISAMVGLANMTHWADRAAQRMAVHHRMENFWDGIEGMTMVTEPLGQDVVWCYCPIVVDSLVDRDWIVDELAQAGIQARKYYRACHRMPAVMCDDVELPVTESVAKRVIALPCYESLSDDDIGYMENHLRKALRQ